MKRRKEEEEEEEEEEAKKRYGISMVLGMETKIFVWLYGLLWVGVNLWTFI